MTLAELRNEYRPYDTLPAFDEGFRDYQLGNYSYGARYHGVAGQAWDRGAECAMKWARQNNRIARRAADPHGPF